MSIDMSSSNKRRLARDRVKPTIKGEGGNVENKETTLASGAAAVPKAAWIVGGVLAVAGIVAFAVQMANQTMAGASQYPWGFYIAMFYAAASAGAGVLVVGGIGAWAGIIEARQVSKLYAVACALFVVASILIVVDLGNPAGIFLTYTSANVASPVFFDAIVLPLCIVFTIVAALVVARGDAATKVVAAIGIVAGLVLMGVEAWLLTTCSGKDAWGVLLGAGPALIQAVTLAAAVVVCFAPASRGWKMLLAGASIVMVAALAFDVVLNGGSDTVLGQQFSAIGAQPLFWIAVVVAVVACVLALVAKTDLLARVAAICAIVAVPLFKLAIFWGTQSIVAIAQLEAAGAFPFDVMEVIVFTGALGIGVLVYNVATLILAKRSLPIKEVQA